jgi:exonuclease VII small subunit
MNWNDYSSFLKFQLADAEYTLTYYKKKYEQALHETERIQHSMEDFEKQLEEMIERVET